jgi:uncharacterized protein
VNVLRRLAPVLTLVFAALFAQAESPATLSKPTSSYVSDFAGVLDGSSKQAIQDLATQVYTKAHATIVVVTVNTLDGQDIESWTTELEDRWKVGPKGSDKGVVLIFAVQDHKDRIEVGYGLEGILNDAKVGDILRSVKPQLQQADYSGGIQSAVQQVANVIAADASVTLATPQMAEQPTYHYTTVHHHSNWIGIVVFVIIVLVISRGGRGGGGGNGGWLWFLLGSMMNGGGGRGGGFGGGGDGGSSGGGDFGGGFGGGSGGGGASGDW